MDSRIIVNIICSLLLQVVTIVSGFILPKIIISSLGSETNGLVKTYNSISTEEQVARDNLKITQTPQSFFIKDIVAAHREALEKGITNSVASCTMYIELGRKLYMSKGSEKNLKLTTTEDIEIFKALLQAKKDEWMH